MKNSEGNGVDFKGKWGAEVFKNDNPIVLELACGKGDYALALAKKYPGRNFIGVDAKGARIYTGAKAAIEAKLNNLAFLRMKIENLPLFFAQDEVSEIWITFPDPFPKKRDAKRRLSAPGFIELYSRVCKPGSTIHFKTDDLPLFLFTAESVKGLGKEIVCYKEDVYAAEPEFEELTIQTYYEKKHLQEGRTIYYLAFRI